MLKPEFMDILNKYLNLIVILISLVTILSGLSQVIMPSFVLELIGAEISPTTSHFFAIIGMFMALFGGLMLHTLYSTHTTPEAVLWCALQKLGAFVAVTLGVVNGIFNPLALGVAIFDLFSGLLFLHFIRKRREQWRS